MTDKTLQDRLRDPSHGFDRNDSHTEDRYVCLCEHLANEAADAIDAQEARIKALEGALRVMYEAEKDYIIRNNLGDPHDNQRMKVARDLLGEK